MKSIKNINSIQELIYKGNLTLSDAQQKHLDNFIGGIIVDSRASISRISKFSGDKNHSNLNRFFTKDWWDEEEFNNQRLIEFINENEIYVLLSDDSDNVKRGKKMKGVGLFKRHEGDGFETAHCKVITGLSNQKGEFFPLFTTIYLKKEDAEKEGTPFRTKTEIVRDHNNKARAMKIDFYNHIYDSAYFCKHLIEHSENKEYIVSILSGRNNIIIDNKKWKSVDFKKNIDKRKMLVFKTKKRKIRHLEYYAELTSGKKVKLIAFIDQESSKIKFLVSTNLEWSAKRIFQEYSKRQSIEVYFRDCKQELNWGKCSFRELKPQAKWDNLVMFAYTILKRFLKTKEAIKRKIKTIGNATDYIRENTQLKPLFARCTT